MVAPPPPNNPLAWCVRGVQGGCRGDAGEEGLGRMPGSKGLGAGPAGRGLMVWFSGNAVLNDYRKLRIPLPLTKPQSNHECLRKARNTVFKKTERPNTTHCLREEVNLEQGAPGATNRTHLRPAIASRPRHKRSRSARRSALNTMSWMHRKPRMGCAAGTHTSQHKIEATADAPRRFGPWSSWLWCVRLASVQRGHVPVLNSRVASITN